VTGLGDELARFADAVDHRTPVRLGLQVVRLKVVRLKVVRSKIVRLGSGRRRRIGRAQGAALPKPSSTLPHATPEADREANP
jgi:hypothetical protein